MWRWYRKRRRTKRVSSVTKHYQTHKAAARELVLARLEHFNQHYHYEWNRVAIRNQRRCWGSCSSLKNLNFSYRLLFLPPHLCDYIIVHELCHLAEMNHRQQFWALVAEQIPNYKERIAELRAFERLGARAVERIKQVDCVPPQERDSLRKQVVDEISAGALSSNR